MGGIVADTCLITYSKHVEDKLSEINNLKKGVYLVGISHIHVQMSFFVVDVTHFLW